MREGAEKAGRELREGAEGFGEGYGGSGKDAADTREREQR